MTASALPSAMTSSAASTSPRSTSAGRRVKLDEPARLRVATGFLVVGVLALGVVGYRSATDRKSAAELVRSTATPRLASAEDVYVKLADADAAASTAFLRGDEERFGLRPRYVTDMHDATKQLSSLSEASSASPAARRALDVINEQLPNYAGLIESARANNGLGYAVGAAYLRSASALMRDQVLPATTTIYEDAAAQADHGFRAGEASSELIAVSLVALGLLAALIVVQVMLAVGTRRVLNLGLVGATVLVVGFGVWSVLAFVRERDALDAAQRRGADTLQVVSTARILTLRAFSDENLELIERGAAPEYIPDFDAVQRQLAGPAGLLAREQAIAARTGDEAEARGLVTGYDDFIAAHIQEQRARNDDRYSVAIGIAVGNESNALANLDARYARSIDEARAQLDAHANRARRSLASLPIAAIVFTVLASVLVVFGLRRRIQEYS